MTTDRPATPDSEDPPRDALAAVLRNLGDLAFAVDELSPDEIARLFDGWARHALVGAPRPGIDREGKPPSGDERDWVGLTRFSETHRRRERDYVVRSLRDLRDVIWAFVHGVAQTVNEESATDQRIAQRLGLLRESVDSGNTAQLKRNALASIELVQETMERRKERQQEQIDALSVRIQGIRDELARARDQLEKDDLTGAYGRGALDQYIQRVVELGTVSGQVATLYMIDCDDFKWVNDSFGHAAGDDVLKALAEAMQSVFRRSSDFVARFGGDEFAIVVPNGKVDEIRDLGDALLHEVRSIEVPSGKGEPIRVGVSIGAARLIPGEDKRRWMERADRALYAAKEGGRDRIEVADVALPETPPTEAADEH